MERFEDLVGSYRALFFDAFGVLCDARGVMPGVLDMLRSLDTRGVPFWILTNDASQTPETLASRYSDRDGAVVGVDRIVGSGMVLTEYLLREHPGAPVAYLGTAASEYYFRAAGAPIVALPSSPGGVEPAAFVLTDENGFDWQTDLTRAVNALRVRPAVDLLAPNPDLIFRADEDVVGIGAGALVTMLEAVLDRPFFKLGKPDGAIFECGLRRARRVLPDLTPAQVLMVGDTLQTDVAGASKVGIDTLLVLSGNTSASLWRDEVARKGITPTHVAKSVTG